MFYITGDTHGDFSRIERFCNAMNPPPSDTLIILGDAGINFYGGLRDAYRKERLAQLPITLFSIHGNHEMRPGTIASYHTTEWYGGQVYVEDDFPNLLFAKDGEIFDLEGNKAIILGGAYSVDKYYRLSKGMNWFSDEQPSDEIKQYVKEKLDACGWKMDLVLSHTCPQKYVPIEAFMSGLDQKLVDHSTEEWLDQIENKLDYNAWYCGHWHIDKRIDKMHFLMHSVEAL